MLNRRDFLMTVIKGGIAATIFTNALSFASPVSAKENNKSWQTDIFKYERCSGIVAVLGSNGVSETDMQRAIEAAGSVFAPPSYKVTHVFPLEYIVDDKNGIENPLRMGKFRSRLEVKSVVIMKKIENLRDKNGRYFRSRFS